MFKVVRKNEAILRKISEKKKVWNVISKEIAKEVSLAVVEAEKGFWQKEASENHRIYYVLQGELELALEGRSERLGAGDGCFIARETEYEMGGAFKAIVVSQPAFGVGPTS